MGDHLRRDKRDGGADAVTEGGRSPTGARASAPDLFWGPREGGLGERLSYGF
jgi:hypothetical protein